MAFWNETSLEPKRQFKFKVSFEYFNVGGSNTAGTYFAQSADRPVYTISDTTKVDYLDKAFHFPGKITWNQVKIKFVDATGGAGGINTAAQTYAYLGRAGYVNPDTAGAGTVGSTQLATIGKFNASRSLGVMVEVLNSDGNMVDKWTLKNAFVTTVALNNLDYSAEGILTAEYTFRYDWAAYESGV